MDQKNGKDSAIPFIVNKDGEFSVSEESKIFLRTLHGKKVGVVCVVGKYRTGKSYFLNKVILNRATESGFNVGPTVNPCTKGLWIWSQTLKKTLSNGEEIDLIVMDCEGFGGMDENENHDTRIFLFAVLLSSYFIYNSLGSIDENALSSLSLVLNLAKDIRSKMGSGSSAGDANVIENFPSLLWVVRDFSLRMEDENGNPITSKQYLENALMDVKGLSEAAENKNRVRSLLKHFFRDRDCCTMIRPVELENDLQKLDTLPEKYLRPQFVEQMQQIRQKILSKTKQKQINHKDITGDMLIHLAKAYAEAVNSGKVPNIESAWNYVCKEKVEVVADKCIKSIQSVVNSEEIKKIMNEEGDWKQETRKRILHAFKVETMAEGQFSMERQLKLEEEMDQKLSFIEKEMMFGQGKKLQKWLHMNFQPIMDQINRDEILELSDAEVLMQRVKTDFQMSHEDVQSQQLEKIYKEFRSEKEHVIMSSIIRAKENKNRMEIERTQSKIENIQEQAEKSRKSYEDQINTLTQRLRESEDQRVQLNTQLGTLTGKLSNMQEKLDYETEKNADKQKKIKDDYLQRNMTLEAELAEAKKALREGELARSEDVQAKTRYESMFMQEKELGKQKIGMMDKEIEQLRNKIAEQDRELIDLKSKLKKGDKSKQLKLVQEELEELQTKKRNQDSQLGNLKMEKQYLDSKIQFLNSQIEEGKKIHETLLSALQNQLNNDENSNTSQLFETNKNLVTSLSKAESRIKRLEMKVAKYKIFKIVVYSSSAIQLKSSGRILPIKHALKLAQSNPDEEIDESQVLKLLSTLSQSEELGANNAGKFNHTHVPYAQSNQHPIHGPNQTSNQRSQSVQATIIHTLVKEEQETGKVFTEYIIELRNSENKCTITKRYKEFVNLHQTLIELYPDLELPSSANQILGFNPSVTNWMANKRKAVIEDRRQALQDYLNELLGMQELAKCRTLTEFLHLEQLNEIQLSSPLKIKTQHGESVQHHQNSTQLSRAQNYKFSTSQLGNNFDTKENLAHSKYAGADQMSRFTDSSRFEQFSKANNTPAGAKTQITLSGYQQNASNLSPYGYKKQTPVLSRIVNNSPYN